MTGKIYVCPKCDRKILVERALFGTGIDHALGIIVICFDCLDKATQKKASERYPLARPTKKDE